VKITSIYNREGLKQFLSAFSYKQNLYNVKGEFSQSAVGSSLPTIKATSVFGKLSSFLGISGNYNLNNNQLSYEIKGQFSDDKLEFTRTISSTDYGASVYYKFDNNIDFGAQYSCKRDDLEESMKFGFGAKLKVNENFELAVKMTETGKIGLGGNLKINNSINFAASALVDSINFNQTIPQFGFSIDLSC